MPLRALRVDVLRKNISALVKHKLLSSKQHKDWEAVCDEEEKRNDNMCETCKELTTRIANNGKRVKDSADESKDKSSKRADAQSELDEHLASEPHAAVANWPLPVQEDAAGESGDSDADGDADMEVKADGAVEGSDSEDSSDSDSDADEDEKMVAAEEIAPEPVPMVYRGARKQRAKDRSPLKEGDLAALMPNNHELCDPPFWIARVTKISDSHIDVAWMNAPHVLGSYRKLGTADSLPRNTTVLAYGFEFKKGNKLRQATLKMLASDSRIQFVIPASATAAAAAARKRKAEDGEGKRARKAKRARS